MVTRFRPYSRSAPLARIDSRTREGRFLKAFRAELIEHVGGTPSTAQRALIERLVWLAFRLALLDAKMARGDDFTEHDSRTYLAWANAFARVLRELGLKPVAAPSPSLADYIAAKRTGTNAA